MQALSHDSSWRWRLVPTLAVLGLALMVLACGARADEGWERYKSRFMTEDGRILDTGNDDVSHSEGQGWGMLLAESRGDRRAFDRLWGWTRRHLTRHDVALFSWRYDPQATPPLSDPNTASDGDILIAWALQRAARRWEDDRYAREARQIRSAIRTYLVEEVAGYRVLLPGLTGFRSDDHVDINLSYWVMPALDAFAEIEPDSGWKQLIEDGQRLLDQGRFGRYRLPTDWTRLQTDGDLRPASSWPPRFGFDAVRIPLYFAWAGLSESKGVAPMLAYWNDPARQPPAAWINVITEKRAEYAASRGVMAIRALIDGESSSLPEAPRETDDYYAASLLMLTRLAAQERPSTLSP